MLNLKHIKAALLIALAMCFLSQKIWAQDEVVALQKIKFTENNRLEITLSKKTNFEIFTLENPPRLVIDVTNGNIDKLEKTVLPAFVTSIRSKNNPNSLRLVFDLNQKITIQKVHFEKVKKENFGKIIAEIVGVKKLPKTATTAPQDAPQAVKIEPQTTTDNPANFISSKVEEFDVQTEKVTNPDGSTKYVVKKIPKNLEFKNNAVLKKLPVIVIDSGHGGKDPGTIGTFARTKEKNLTLSYAKELGKQLINTKRYRVYLTRDTDIFIPLKKRVDIARKKKADLFISLHANAIADSDVAGFSIYTLSEKSSDRQAELLAQKENRADIINGVNFSNASADVMKTLIDLSQRDTMNGSSRFASIAVKSIKNSEINILQNSHRFAGFAVLTAPDMLSVLIELGYLSNKDEEKLLNSLIYKRKVAESLTQAIDEYFAKNKT